MMKIKTAKKYAQSYEIVCPKCGETIVSPGGSMFWETAEIYPGKIVQCFNCKAEVRLPKA